MNLLLEFIKKITSKKLLDSNDFFVFKRIVEFQQLFLTDMTSRYKYLKYLQQ
jgi:hypothetical protein